MLVAVNVPDSRSGTAYLALEIEEKDGRRHDEEALWPICGEV